MHIEQDLRMPGAVVLQVKGEVTNRHFHRFNDATEPTQYDGRSLLILDIRLVQFIASIGIGALITALRAWRRADGLMVLTKPKPPVAEVLHRIGIEKIISIYDNVNEAYQDNIGADGRLIISTELPKEDSAS